MENLDKYIGIKFKIFPKYSDTEKYNNCIGLVKMFYNDHNYKQTFDDGEPWYTFNIKNNPIKRIYSYFRNNFKKVKSIDELEFGDIVFLYVGLNLGIYLGDNKILTFEKEYKNEVSETKIFTLDEIGKENIKCCYKR